MGDSSDSEEFYDAEEFTPVKGSKRSSLCKNINLSDIANAEKEKAVANKDEPVAANTSQPSETAEEQDDRTTIKSVVQGRKRFQELRRCMQTEEEDDADPAALMSAPMEHPFKIISHDAMSLQSMTSLGRIGKILSGVTESHPNIRECIPPPSASSREPSTASEDPIPVDRTPTVLAMAEPDVIASTKANSLKQNRSSSAVVAVCGASGAPPRPASAAGPVAPPRRKKRNKLHGSQSLSAAEDNVSVCTTDTDELYRPHVPHARLESLHVQPPLNSSAQCMLPSPASTIESLTKEFQDSLELSQSKYAADMEASARWERHYDEPDSARGEYTPRTSEEAGRGGARTHSETRPVPPQHNDSSSRSSTGGGRARRRSAGDSPARAPLSDSDILTRVTVLNLDTGERMPLSEAEHKLPQCINPLSLHIMRLTSEYHGRAPDDHTSRQSKCSRAWRARASLSLTYGLRRSPSAPLGPALSALSIDTRETDEESESVCAGGADDETKDSKREPDKHTTTIRKRTEKLKRFFGSTMKRTVDAALSLAQEVSAARHKEDVGDIPDLVHGEHNIKLKASNSHRGPYDFDGIKHVQEMGSGHTGAVWCCKFSGCGRLLATAGQDRLLRVWVTRDSHHMFQEMRTKYNKEKKASPSPSTESLRGSPEPPGAPLPPAAPFCPQPFAVYAGHTSDLLDVSWSKNYFLLSSSMDKTVRLWHICRGECLCCFQHIDFVTAIVFHPRDDRYFLSGSLDGKLRLWDIPDKKVAVWNEVDGKTKLITAANFCQNGKFAVVGTYDGRCIFYTTDQLKYHTQIDVRSTRGKNSTGRKISGIEPMPTDDKILVTSNDSRIRLYDLRDLALSCKYRGYANASSQIKASFSHDGKYIVSGSENQCIYVWKTCHDYGKFASVRRDRNDFWEGIRAHGAVVTCAVFAPAPDRYIRAADERERAERGDPPPDEHDDQEDLKAAEGGLVSRSQTGHVLVSADFNGCIKVFVHKAKPKHSSLPASALA